MSGEESISGEGGLSLRERHRQAQEEAILAATHSLVQEKGFEATTMDEIAARANISKPTLYARFPSKEAIVIRAVVELQKDWLAFLRSLPRELPPEARLRTVLNRIFVRKLVLRKGPFGVQRSALTPQIRMHPEYQKHSAEMVAEIMAIIEEGQHNGMFDPICHPRIVAQTMFSFVRDSEMDELITSGTVSAEAAVETLTEIILRGIEKR
jgi:AcrR family transcriptional regulator